MRQQLDEFIGVEPVTAIDLAGIKKRGRRIRRQRRWATVAGVLLVAALIPAVGLSVLRSDRGVDQALASPDGGYRHAVEVTVSRMLPEGSDSLPWTWRGDAWVSQWGRGVMRLPDEPYATSEVNVFVSEPGRPLPEVGIVQPDSPNADPRHYRRVAVASGELWFTNLEFVPEDERQRRATRISHAAMADRAVMLRTRNGYHVTLLMDNWVGVRDADIVRASSQLADHLMTLPPAR